MVNAQRLPLTAAQRGLWYAHQLDPDNAVLNIAHYVDVAGALNIEAYRAAWAQTIDEVDALRATYAEDDSGPHQLVADRVEWQLDEIDVRDSDDPAAAAKAWMNDDLRRPRDLKEQPLFRIVVLALSDEQTFCYQRIHHIALDGYGATLAMIRVNGLYNSALAGETIEESPVLTAPVADLVADDENYRLNDDSEDRADDRGFWVEELGDRPHATVLAGTPSGLPDRLARCTRDVDADTARALLTTAERIGVSRSSLLIAAFAAYLHRWTGERDVVLGLPVTARTTDVAKMAPGMVSSIVPLRLEVRPDQAIDDLARLASKKVRALLPHQRFRPEDIREALDLDRDVRLAGPTINILPTDGDLVFGEHVGTLHNLSVGPVDDMSVIVSRAPDGAGLRIDVDANPHLYDERDLEGHVDRFILTLEAFGRESSGDVGAYTVATAADRAVTDVASRGVAVDVLRRTVLDFFEAQVRRSPDATALVSAAASLTFSEVDRRANRLARELIDRGVGPGRTVAVALPRSELVPITLIAAHKAGAACLPIDPTYPLERIRHMLDDASPTCVVTDCATQQDLPDLSGKDELPVLLVDDEDTVGRVLSRSTDPVDDEVRGATVHLDDPAYVIYTSGSTGRPKGIVVQHRSLVNLFASHSAEIFAPARAAVGGRALRVAHTTAVSFDAFWDGAMWLVGGHEMHFVEERVMQDPEALVAYLVDHKVDFVETTPTYMAQMMEAGLLGEAGDQVKVLALGGEAIGEELWRRLSERDDLLAYNFFGPAESTVDVTFARIADHDLPVIGRPVNNTRAYVLDGGLQVMPVGAAGELYLAGAGLARSYLDQPRLTAERFVADPHGPAGTRMYRTGDVARWRADGMLDFVARVDDQVKVRGFRVELGEIEARLGAHDDVSAAAVVMREQDDVQQLVAYVAGDRERIDVGALREHVRQAVPDYMVPAAYVILDALPLTTNGKLDREALPAPGTDDVAGGGRGREARTPEELLLAGLFAETLGLAEVGADDDFFHLGGHSLLATRLVSRIRSAAGVELPIRALFDHPTVAGLAAQLGGAAERRPELRPMARPDRLPLSYAQRRLWFLNRLEPDSAAYNIPAVLRLRGELNREALQHAVHDLLTRHETLRTIFSETDGEPEQVVLDFDEVTAPFEARDVDGDTLAADLAREAARGFDLETDLPLRVTLHRISDEDHVLSLVVHHVAGDGWSLGPLAADLATAYAARLGALPPDWSPLPVQYVDYALWQQEVLGDEDDASSAVSEQLAYWSKQLADVPDELDLPRDRPRPQEPGVEGGTVEVTLPAEVRDALAATAQRHEVSLFMVVEALVAALLARMGGGDDVPVGVPLAGRTDEALDGLVGFFVNTLVIRNDLSGDPSFDDLVDRVKQTALDAYAHQDVPFERLVEELRPERSLARHPLFQVMLAFQNNEDVALDLPGLEVSVDAASGPVGAKFDLSFDLGEQNGVIAGAVEYDAALFDHETVQDLVVRLGRMAAAVATDPSASLSAALLLSDNERIEALGGLDRQDLASAGATVLATFAETVARAPDAVAVTAGEEQLTFAELDDCSARLAALLVRRGVDRGRVGVALPRTPDLVVALLAVLRSGAVYLPIDLEYPAGRIEQIVSDASPALVITTSPARDVLPDDVEVLLLDQTDLDHNDRDGVDESQIEVGPRDPAYLTYTSGSTGRPKGVLVEHVALANLLVHHTKHLHEPTAERLGRQVRMAHTTAVSFDAAWDPVLWMVSGHELVLVDDATRRDSEALITLLADLDVIETTPSYVRTLLAGGLDRAGLALIALGGEAIPAGLWQDLRALHDEHGTEAINLYGPTETTVDALIARVADHDQPVVGVPVDGTAAYVLDARLAPLPAGVAGELYLAGVGLARGYAGRPGLTAERFVANPFGPAGSRMYRTGDLVRRRRDGVIDFVGRVDDQVKLRGFRVELGEVESVLAEHPEVAAAAVDVRGGEVGQLTAWLVPANGAAPEVDDVRRLAATTLPDYMVPVAWAVVDELPLTPNGKLDRAALSDASVETGGGGRAADTDAERALARIFADVLDTGDDEVAADVSFFDLGGHSLLATRLVSRIRTELGVELPIRALFEAPTVAQLAERLPEAAAARRPLEPVDRPDVMPLSWAQYRLWFLHRLEDSSAAYHIPVAVRLDGELDVDALTAALGDVVSRHEILRTTLPDIDGEPRQEVHDDATVDLETVDIGAGSLDTELRRRAETPFDLGTDRPLRASLLRLDDREHVLLLVMHHVAADGWSMGPLGRDLAVAYAARCRGDEPDLAPLPVQYADYTLWQREIVGDHLGDQLAFWTERLAGLPAELDLPTDRPRPVEATFAGGEVGFEIDADLHRRLIEVARVHDASVFMLLQAVLAGLLTRLGGGTDIPLGSPVAGRTDEALDDLVGFFINTLVLRTDTTGDPTLVELLDRVRRADLDAFAHQDLPFERLVEELAPERSLARHPLFQVMLTLNQQTPADLGLHGLGSRLLPVAAGSAKFDLSLSVEEREDDGEPAGLSGVLEHATDLYDEVTAVAITERLVRLLEGWLTDPGLRLSAVPLLTDAERNAVLVGFNERTPAVEVADPTVVHAWTRTVAQTPDAVALVCGDETLTFAQLDDAACRLAMHLRGHDIGRGDIVALGVPRSAETVVGLLGTLRAGATYLPLDPTQPEERIASITRAAQPALVLDSIPSDLPDDGNLPPLPRSDDAAYVIFTSGSTGEPKGVVVEHGSLAALLAHHREHLHDPAERELGRRLRVAHTTAVTFDAAWDAVLWMVAGHTLDLVDDQIRVDPEALVGHVVEHNVDALETTPSYVDGLLRAGLPELTVVALGGEAVSDDLWQRLRARGGRAVNLYGPTETTVDTLVADLADHEHPVIGSPVAGTRAYVLDDRLQPVAPGVAGELYLAGASLARGYLGQAGLTAERFVAHPYGGPGERIYRTGDRASWRVDGSLAFGGRVDDQVKVRGFRVELGEVESVLEGCAGVDRAAALVGTDASGAGRLDAYLVAEGGAELDLAEVRAEAARRLPDYMLPTAMAVLDDLPLTPNGKLDRRGLPEPARVGAGGGAAPRTPTERVLAGLFAELLGAPEVGVDDNFFELGGHSLLATQLVSRIRAVTGADVPVRALFEAPNVSALAERLDEGTTSGGTEVLLGLRTSGERTPLVALHPVSGLAWAYAGLAGHLEDRPLLGLQVPGLDGSDLPEDAGGLVEVYVSALRTVRPEGPYALLGWSLGGVLAHRVATRLVADGEVVEALVLVDSYPDALPEEAADETKAYIAALGGELDATMAALDDEVVDRLAHAVARVGRLLRDADPPPAIDVPTTIVASKSDHSGPPFAEQWAAYLAGEVVEHAVPHAHFDLMDPAALADVGPLVSAALNRTVEGAES